ncbi:Kelch-like protein 30 [Colletotrichum higginsianum IMI 349063]|uniref:Kelch-like protein 30 n=1 Tax=Colletotrichum higginsianum (strain IMI 349063) TaxID=759273 RepID=A0A1B7XY86_COLHI|nr:Kelch-like protein 30 [Colletotrichum higginsianum IMI 349063]OBR04704.1 Kelch-like protein 30 [Colletotrichum higginsianum IMI 349063]
MRNIESGPQGSHGTAASKDAAAWFFLAPKPKELVKLKCGDKSFSFRKSILVKDSEYFRACLTNPAFVEARTSTIVFDDIEPELFGFYLHMVYLRAAGKRVDTTPILFKDDSLTAPGKGLAAVVKLYQIADRFLNTSLLSELGNEIVHFAEHGSCSVELPGPRALQKPFANPDQPRRKEHRTMNPETPVGRIWWTKVLRNAYDVLDKDRADQNFMKTRLVEILCDKVPTEHAFDIVPVLSESKEFLSAVSFCLAKKVSSLKAQVKVQSREVERLRYQNQTSGSQLATLRATTNAEISRLYNKTSHMSVMPSYSYPDDSSDDDDDYDGGNVGQGDPDGSGHDFSYDHDDDGELNHDDVGGQEDGDGIVGAYDETDVASEYGYDCDGNGHDDDGGGYCSDGGCSDGDYSDDGYSDGGDSD